MNARMSRFVASMAAFFGAAAVSLSAWAAPVSVDLTSLRAIQTYNLEDKADDQAYVLVTGVAKGKELEPTRLPKEGAWTVGPKKPALEDKDATLWSGDLADGEFALLTVTLFQGKGDEAAIKAYTAKKAEAEKGVANRAAPKITAEQAETLSEDLLKAHRDMVVKINDVVGGREKNTDHFGGQFTLLVRNEGGKIKKRLDPVGLTFGEHAGIDAKRYSKIKRTLQNVLLKDDAGELYEDFLEPIDEDTEEAVRVKMLETEFVKQGDKTIKNVTDYLAEVQVKVDGEPQTWSLEGENLGISDVHTWWDWVE